MEFYFEGKEQEYMSRYQIFLQKCPQIEIVAKVLRSHLPAVLRNVANQLNNPNEIKILSVGSGHGKMDIEILKIVHDEMERMKEKSPVHLPDKMFNRAIEPNKASLILYKDVIKNLPKELSKSNIVFDIGDPKTFQEYMLNPRHPRGEFDIVHLIHSMYFLDVEQALTYCYEKELGEKGIMITAVGLGEGDIFHCMLEKHFELESQVGAENVFRRPLGIEKEVLKVAEKKSWKYREYIQEYHIDVTDVFDKDSVPGNLLLDFLLQTVNFRATVDQQIVDEYLDVIRKRSVVEDGKYLSKQIASVVFIYK